MSKGKQLEMEVISPDTRRRRLIEEDDISQRSSVSPTRRLELSESTRLSELHEGKRSRRSEKLERAEEEQGGSKGGKKKKRSKEESLSIFKIFFNYTLHRKKLAVACLILSLLYGAGVSMLPLQIGDVLDYITTTKTADSVQQLPEYINKFLMLIGIAWVLAICRFFFTRLLEDLLAMDMRNDIFAKFMHFDMYFFEQYKTGQLVMRLSSDINQAKSAVSNSLAYFLRSVVTVLMNLIILFTISWKLAFLIFFSLPIYGFLTLYYSKLNRKLVKKSQQFMGEMSANTAEKFGGIQLVKAYSCQAKEVLRYAQINNKSFDNSLKRAVLNSGYLTIIEFLPYLSIVLVLYFGGRLILSGDSDFTPGELTSFIMYCSMIASNTNGISNSYTSINNGIGAIQKVCQMTQYAPLVREHEGDCIEISGDIELANIRFKYPTSTALVFEGLSLKINKGEYIAFVGESGSGKSTIIKLIQQFYPLQAGKIFFGAYDSSTLNINHLRGQIGFVNQDATMFSGSIEENITYGLDSYTSQELHNAALLSGSMQFLKNEKAFPLGFKTEVGEKGCSLSGGQRQRISIARALIRRPKILIFDEATSALDANSEQTVQQAIESIARKEDRATILVIAHRLSTVINADRIVAMRNGEIVQIGSHQQLLKDRNGYYFQLVQKQLNEKPLSSKE